MVDFEVLILAAGRASRFGSPKQLASFRGKPLLMHVIDAVTSVGKKPWLALGAHRGQIEANSNLDLDNCHLVDVADWQHGMSRSIRAGLQKIRDENRAVEGVLVLLADQPQITSREITLILKCVKTNRGQIVCSQYEKVDGVPAYFPKAYFDDLISLSGDQGAKGVIRTHPHISLAFGAKLVDIDTPDQLAFLGDE